MADGGERPKLSPGPGARPADWPAHLPTAPNDCLSESVDAEPGLGWALMGTHQDLLGGYEAGSLLISDSERMPVAAPR